MFVVVGCVVICLLIVSIVATVTLLQDITYQLITMRRVSATLCDIIANKLDCNEEYARLVPKTK